ncbi:hypothetical protein HC256_007906 [Beauveria bassiana]|nr:hypothetical protein HC256_007906 [Beauveria bassiana]
MTPDKRQRDSNYQGCTYANNAVRANQLDVAVLNGALGVALGVRLNVAEITNVADGVRGSAVGLAVRVEVRASRGAAVGVVTKGVDVEAALRVGVVARDVPGDGGGSRLGLLLKGDSTGNLGVATKDTD